MIVQSKGFATSQSKGFANSQSKGFANSQSKGFANSQSKGFATSQSKGFAILCDMEGNISRILRDDISLTQNTYAIGRKFATLFTPRSHKDVEAFLDEIKIRSAKIGWELEASLDAQTTISVYVAGGKVTDQLLLVGERRQADISLSFYEALMRINNEQMNALRAALKHQALEEQTRKQREAQDSELYKQQTELNNELIALQREIIKKNTALQRYAERLRIQHNIDRAILALQSPEAIATATLERICNLISAQYVSVVEVDTDTQQSRILALYLCDKLKTDPQLSTYIPDVDPTSQNLVNLTKREDDAESTSFEKLLYEAGLRYYIAIPLIAQRSQVGSLYLATDQSRAFGSDAITIAHEVADSLAVALEQARLYQQTQQDALTKAALLREVNHRVSNNLTAIIGLLYAELRHASDEKGTLTKAVLERLIQRVKGLAEVHSTLSKSQWTPVRLSELTSRLIEVALSALPADQYIEVHISPSPVTISPREANGIALVINELATNTVKYAMQDRAHGNINVEITQEGPIISFVYRDDGPGYPESVLSGEHQNIGMYLIKRFVILGLNGELRLENHNGATTMIRFETEVV